MVIIPLQPVPNQTLNILLGVQPTQINLYTKATGMFIDVLVSDVAIIVGTIVEDRNPVVRSVYLGFIGDLMMFDTQGTDDPSYTGLGSRWVLAYLTSADFP